MTHLQIIVGSTRPNRAADTILPWLVERASADPRFDVEVLDLRDWPLPLFNEDPSAMGDLRDPTYSDPVVKRWNDTIRQGDAYLVLSPEYNHSVTGVLKNAIDSVFLSFGLRNKPIAAVGYSGGVAGGSRAVEHLAHIAIEADMHPLRSSVIIPFLGQAFADGKPVNPVTDAALQIVLDDLAWWSAILEPARAAGELPPGVFRLRAAMEAAG